MDTKWKVVIVTLVVAIPAFALGANAPGGGFWEAVWPWASEAEEMSPAGGLVPFFIVLGVVEALSLGLAVSFLAFGMPAARRLAAGSQRRARWVSVSVAWVLETGGFMTTSTSRTAHT